MVTPLCWMRQRISRRKAATAPRILGILGTIGYMPPTPSALLSVRIPWKGRFHSILFHPICSIGLEVSRRAPNHAVVNERIAASSSAFTPLPEPLARERFARVRLACARRGDAPAPVRAGALLAPLKPLRLRSPPEIAPVSILVRESSSAQNGLTRSRGLPRPRRPRRSELERRQAPRRRRRPRLGCARASTRAYLPPCEGPASMRTCVVVRLLSLATSGSPLAV